MACVVWPGLAGDINLGQSPKMLQIASHKSVGFYKVLIFIIKGVEKQHQQETDRSNSAACLPVVKVDVVKTRVGQLSDTQIYRVGCCCLVEWLLVVVGCVQWM